MYVCVCIFFPSFLLRKKKTEEKKRCFTYLNKTHTKCPDTDNGYFE